MRGLLRIVGLAVFGLLVGCGADDRLETAPVSGTVTYNGEPVRIGSVMFVPEGSGPTASGKIDRDGNYTLKTYVDGDGAIPGEHKVVVTAMTSQGGSGLPEDAIDGLAGLKSVIPERYGDLGKTDLLVTVNSGEENTIDLALKD